MPTKNQLDTWEALKTLIPSGEQFVNLVLIQFLRKTSARCLVKPLWPHQAGTYIHISYTGFVNLN